jgi:hypothetical protein
MPPPIPLQALFFAFLRSLVGTARWRQELREAQSQTPVCCGVRKDQSAGRQLGRARRPRSPRPTLERERATESMTEGFGRVGEDAALCRDAATRSSAERTRQMDSTPVAFKRAVVKEKQPAGRAPGLQALKKLRKVV